MNRKERRAAETSRPSPFAAALRHHREGNLIEAERHCRQALTTQPRHADSLNLLGVICCQLGRAAEGIALIRRAIVLSPGVAAYHSNLGNILGEQNQPEAALICLRRAIALAPDHAEAHNNLGKTLLQLGQPEAALGPLARATALRPDYPEALCNLGLALTTLKRPAEAVARLRAAVALRPHYPQAHGTLGAALRALGETGAAAACFRTAIAQQPDDAGAHNNLGTCLLEQGLPEQALASFRTAVALRPGYGEAHYDMGTALRQLGRLAEAAACFRQALALRPDFRDAHTNLGITLAEAGDADQAARCLRAAVALDPMDADAHNNLGTVARQLGELDAARASYRRAVELNPALADAHFNLATVLLAQGDLAAGWEEFEWRWQTPQMQAGRRDFAQPTWRGEAAAGRTLLIHAEQGFGDTLQFCRFAPLAAARGLRVILEVQPPLVRLLRTLPGVAAVVPAGTALPDFDLHCPMLSLPRAFATTLANIPAAPYLHADPEAAAAGRLRDLPRPQIGLVWAGNPRSFAPALAAVDRRRSMDPALLAPLFAIPGLQFVSLQKDGPRPPANLPMIDVMEAMTDFADTAALVAGLDLVIAVDTAVAHLAAALGRPVWLLDRFDSCWRWLTGRRDSPWYPSLRLYRQPAPGDWGTVIDAVVRDLCATPGWGH